MKKVEEYIRNIPDFPEEGIIFRDVTTVLQDAEGLKLAIDSMIRLLDGVDFDVVAGIERVHFWSSDRLRAWETVCSDPQKRETSL